MCAFSFLVVKHSDLSKPVGNTNEILNFKVYHSIYGSFRKERALYYRETYIAR